MELEEQFRELILLQKALDQGFRQIGEILFAQAANETGTEDEHLRGTLRLKGLFLSNPSSSQTNAAPASSQG